MKTKNIILVVLTSILMFVLGGFVVYQVVAPKENLEDEKTPANKEENYLSEVELINNAENELIIFLNNAEGAISTSTSKTGEILTDDFKYEYTRDLMNKFYKDNIVWCENDINNIIHKETFDKLYKEIWKENYKYNSSIINELINNKDNNYNDYTEEFRQELKNNNILCNSKKYSTNEYYIELPSEDYIMDTILYNTLSINKVGANKYKTRYFGKFTNSEDGFIGDITFTYDGNEFMVTSFILK